MTATRTARPQTASAEIPAMPLTIEGYSVLHQMMRFRWSAWRQLRAGLKREIVQQAAGLLNKMEQSPSGQSALYSVLGHKGDLMFVHFRSSFDELNRAEMQLSRLKLSDYLEPATSYLSVIELGLYESSVKTYRELAEQGLEPHSDEWKQAINETLARQKDEHGQVGRRYAGEVKQIITGSIGFDDWEWGVDLFADDPLVFKKLIYEKPFDN